MAILRRPGPSSAVTLRAAGAAGAIWVWPAHPKRAALSVVRTKKVRARIMDALTPHSVSRFRPAEGLLTPVLRLGGALWEFWSRRPLRDITARDRVSPEDDARRRAHEANTSVRMRGSSSTIDKSNPAAKKGRVVGADLIDIGPCARMIADEEG